MNLVANQSIISFGHVLADVASTQLPSLTFSDCKSCAKTKDLSVFLNAPLDDEELDFQIQAIQNEIDRIQEVKRALNLSSPPGSPLSAPSPPPLFSDEIDLLCCPDMSLLPENSSSLDNFNFLDLPDLTLATPPQSPSSSSDASETYPDSPSNNPTESCSRRKQNSPTSLKRRRSRKKLVVPQMSSEELRHSISYVLPQDKLGGVIAIVSPKKRRKITKFEQLQIDIDSLDQDTRDRLACYVYRCLQTCMRQRKRDGSKQSSLGKKRSAFETSALFEVEEVLTISSNSTDDELEFIDIMN